MSDYDDYKQRMKEKFEREKEQQRGTGLLGGLFQSKEIRPEDTAQNNPISDYELAKELQEAELKKPLNQNSNNVYDFRGNVNPFEPSGPSRLQQVPRGSDVELNDYSNPQTNAINYIPPNQRTINKQRSGAGGSVMGNLKNQIKEQMTPTVKLLCYLNGAFLLFIFIPDNKEDQKNKMA